jgi:hypothetical protein
MAWTGVGSGNLIAAVTDRLYFGQVALSSLQVASGTVMQTTANIAGSAAAIVGNPHRFLQINVGVLGEDLLIPMYKKA